MWHRIIYNGLIRRRLYNSMNNLPEPQPKPNKPLFKDEPNGGCHPDNLEERVEKKVWKDHNVNDNNLANEEDEIIRQMVDEYRPNYKPPYTRELNEEEDE